MRLLLWLTLPVWLSFFSLRGDSNDDKIYMLAQGCDLKDGSLEIYPYQDSILWLNGVRQDTHLATSPLILKPGDVIITGSPWLWENFQKPEPAVERDFCRYRLAKISPTRADFTLSVFASIKSSLGSESFQYRVGALKTSSPFQIDLSKVHFLLVDYGWNHLELSWKRPSRMK